MRHVISRTAAAAAAALLAVTARADERRFTYSYEPDVLPKGQIEFEQWLTARLDRDGGDYSGWDFREEIEWGLTEQLTTALYLNFTDEFFAPDDPAAGGSDNGMDFKGVSSEWKYLILSPYEHPVGVLAYVEGSTDGAHEYELEEKLVLGAVRDAWVAAVNLVLEQEWETEGGETEEESSFEATAGLSRKLNGNWALGLEATHVRGYTGGVDLSDEEYSATFAGPNIHYGTGRWWWTLTVLPQVHGDGDGADDGLQLAHRERVETRLLAGILF
jgi:hypothetical protein